ncbi:MAG: nucleotidyltransferase domain-containing protein [Nanoarchaeota archaeon]|nr:nucleotidyltransferase domain-containing protein [Nanoarchaeota archaeon]
MRVLETKTTLKLAKALLDEPLHEFKETELIKKAKTGKGSAGNLINELVKERIILEKRVGKSKIICLNMQSRAVFLLKNLLNQERLSHLPKSKLASVLLFTNLAKGKSELLLVFGSCIAQTATEKSDIDILIVSNNPDSIQAERKKTEELFGERLNLHSCTKQEIKNKAKSDMFIQNALLKGVLLHGYDLAMELFFSINRKKDLERLFFFNDRIKSALRNYLNKDYKTAEEILERTIEQMVYYLLSENGVGYTSRKDAVESIKRLPEGPAIQKINRAPLKEKMGLSERFILDNLKNKIIREECYDWGN